MKRHKRNKISRAFTKGYQVGLYGKSKDLCPFQDLEYRQAWLGGWRSGREDNWDGMIGTAGVGRVPAAY